MTKEEQQPLSGDKSLKKGCWSTTTGKIAIAIAVIIMVLAAIATGIALSLSKKEGM